MAVQLVVFDVGGVLIRICRSWAEVFERSGIPPTDALDDEQVFQSNNLYEIGQMDTDELVDHLTRLAPQFTVDQALVLIGQWLVEPYPGIAELVDQVTQTGIATACLSNTNPRHWQTMLTDPRYRAIPMLQHHITSFAAGTMKPHAGIYEALEQTVDVAPDRILFFDDHEPNLAVARKRGWQGCLVDHAGDTAAQMVDCLRTVGVL